MDTHDMQLKVLPFTAVRSRWLSHAAYPYAPISHYNLTLHAAAFPAVFAHCLHTQGGFCYVAMVNLVPELLTPLAAWSWWKDVLAVTFGVAMVLVTMSLD
jgi:hypothetical protein